MSSPPSPSIDILTLAPPTQKIRTEEDVQTWKLTSGYKDYGFFLRRLVDSVVGFELPYHPRTLHPGVKRVLEMLCRLESWVAEIPPLDSPQRFGNLAFRSWGKRLEDQATNLLHTLISPSLSQTQREGEETQIMAMIAQLRPYLVISFGSFTRMDYGTGHETAFVLFLMCLTLIGFFQSPSPSQHSSQHPSESQHTEQDQDLKQKEEQQAKEINRQLALLIFPRYLYLTYTLQDTYRLEPAGSHGVWGLDDSSFLPYVFGSAMLRDQDEIAPNAILRTGLPKTNLYFVAVERVREVKKGPFHEHSSQLHSIAVGVPRWKKVNEGLMKMYEAEVLGKRVVVQHLPLGGLVKWDPPPTGGPPVMQMQMQGVEYQHQHPPAAHAGPAAGEDATMTTTTTTGAPWASTSTSTSPEPERWSLSPSMMTVPSLGGHEQLGRGRRGRTSGFGGIAFEQEQFWIPRYTPAPAPVSAPAVSALGARVRAEMVAGSGSRAAGNGTANTNATSTSTAAPWSRTNAGAGAGAAPPRRAGDEGGDGDDGRWGVPMRR